MDEFFPLMDTSYVHLCDVFTVMDIVFSLYMSSINWFCCVCVLVVTLMRNLVQDMLLFFLDLYCNKFRYYHGMPLSEDFVKLQNLIQWKENQIKGHVKN